MTKRQEQGDATRVALVAAARELFAEVGFQATSTSDVCQRAGVSRGPLYYHFKDKTQLFRAVFVELEKEYNDAVIAAAMGQGDLWATFVAGSRAALTYALRPDYRQIVLTDGPSVLGLTEWHEIDASLGIGTMEFAVRAMVHDGVIEVGSPRHLAILLFGAMNQAALEIVHADDPEVEMEAFLSEFVRTVEHLRPAT